LSLRKEKTDDQFMKKREEMLKTRRTNQDYVKLEIKEENLNLPEELLQTKLNNFVKYFYLIQPEWLNFVSSLLTTDDINRVKLGVIMIRRQTVSQNPPINEFLEAGLAERLIDTLENNITDESIQVYFILIVV
jgi:hypothetical protein